jgi:hypothetical protein
MELRGVDSYWRFALISHMRHSVPREAQFAFSVKLRVELACLPPLQSSYGDATA